MEGTREKEERVALKITPEVRTLVAQQAQLVCHRFGNAAYRWLTAEDFMVRFAAEMRADTWVQVLRDVVLDSIVDGPKLIGFDEEIDPIRIAQDLRNRDRENFSAMAISQEVFGRVLSKIAV